MAPSPTREGDTPSQTPSSPRFSRSSAFPFLFIYDSNPDLHCKRYRATACLHPQAALWDMSVGNPVALCDTYHTSKEMLTRPISEYFTNNPDCCAVVWHAWI